MERRHETVSGRRHQEPNPESGAEPSAGRLKQEKIEYLAHNYIDADMARRIADQFDRFGDDSESLFLANTASWTDRGAAETFRAAVLKDADKAMVTPGQDKPLWMSTEWANRRPVQVLQCRVNSTGDD